MAKAISDIERAAQAKNAAQLTAAINVYGGLITTRTPRDDAIAITERAWQYLAHLCDEASREQLMAASKEHLKIRLNFDSKAPEYLTAGRAAFATEEYANAVRSLTKAIEAGAAFEESDQINLAIALLANKKN